MKYISISGAVAAGKTTLLEQLLKRLGNRAKAHEERPQDNPFIHEYYSDSARWSFHSQIAFLALYFDDPKWKNPTTDFFSIDRLNFKKGILTVVFYYIDPQEGV